MMNVAVFVSGGGSNLQAILDAKQAGKLPEATLSLVVASRTGTKAALRAQAYGIDSVVLRRKDYADQAAYDRALLHVLEPYGIGLVVLAGFLTKLGPDFVCAYEKRIMNIHPSLLPEFGGQGFYGLKPHEAVLAAGRTVTGATVHLVTADYDDGAILCQKEVTVMPSDTAEALQLRVMKEAEHLILPKMVDLFTKGELSSDTPGDQKV